MCVCLIRPRVTLKGMFVWNRVFRIEMCVMIIGSFLKITHAAIRCFSFIRSRTTLVLLVVNEASERQMY